MSYKIVGDSCCDFTPEDRKKETMLSVPLTLMIGDYEVVDDEAFNQADFLKRMAEYPGCPKSACPSPEAYMEAYDSADDIYVVTLSSKLSGSYNSAVVAREMYLENKQKNIHVFDSMLASSGQMLIVRKLEEYLSEGLSFLQVVEKTEQFIKEMKLYFVLENLDNLRKNGRLSKVKAAVASMLNIKPVLCGLNGEIEQLAQGRGMQKAMVKMVEFMEKDALREGHDRLLIAHCNCYERAVKAKEMILAVKSFPHVEIIDTKGISSLYANQGGIIISY